MKRQDFVIEGKHEIDLFIMLEESGTLDLNDTTTTTVRVVVDQEPTPEFAELAWLDNLRSKGEDVFRVTTANYKFKKLLRWEPVWKFKSTVPTLSDKEETE